MDNLNNKKLENLRQEIDEIDRSLINLFETRMEKALEIADYKLSNHLTILDESREHKVMENVRQIKNKKLMKPAEEFLKSLMGISKGVQVERFSGTETKVQSTDPIITEQEDSSAPVIGFQGIPGSYSEQALRDYFGEGSPKKNYVHFEDVFTALEAGEISYGVLPLENSFTGGISEVYDLLCKFGFYIVGEKCVKVDHNLLAVKKAKLDDIQEIYTHPQGFQQCSNYLKAHSEWNLFTCSNTAVSAKLIADSGSLIKASIGSRRAAELYGLNILKEGINNNPNNFTRFIIIGRDPEFGSNSNKISIAVAIAHEPGSLHRVLSHFSRNGLNMLKIESRPMMDKTWEYLFYIDIEGNLENKEVKKAVQGIEEENTFFQLLGNYRADSK